MNWEATKFATAIIGIMLGVLAGVTGFMFFIIWVGSKNGLLALVLFFSFWIGGFWFLLYEEYISNND